MNIVQQIIRIGEITDRTRTARHSDAAYINNINAAIWLIVKDRAEPIRANRRYSVQETQRIRDELYTLIPAPATGAPSSGVVPYPANYFYYLLLYTTINGTSVFCTPKSYNVSGPLNANPFMKPSITKPYYNEFTNGLRVDFGSTGTFSAYELTYIKNPATVSIGQPRNHVTDGGAIATGTLYYVYWESVYAGVTYKPGETFTGLITNLTLSSGKVIPSTSIVNCDLPVNMHDEVCFKAAALLSGNVENFQKKNDLDVEVERN